MGDRHMDMVQQPAPARGWRLAPVVGLGVVLLLLSPLLAWLATHPAAFATSSADHAAPVLAGPERKAVAIAWVDVPGGVAALYPLKPGRVVRVVAEEGK